MTRHSTLRFAPLTLLLLPGCTPPDLDPLLESPTPAATDNGYYRLDRLELASPSLGFDLDADGKIDNHLPYLFDTFYETLESVVLPILEEELGADQAELTWNVISEYLVEQGVPINADGYSQALLDATRDTSLITLLEASYSSGTITAEFEGGTAGTDGYFRGDSLGVLTGSTELDPTYAALSGEAVEVRFPQEALSFTAYSAPTTFVWNSLGVKDGSVGGMVLVDDVVTGVVSLLEPLADALEEQNIELPLDEITVALTLAIYQANAPDGSNLADQEYNAEPAISAAWIFEAYSTQPATR
jgi:hypothetical protein